MFRSIISTFSNCFKIPELSSRIWFTLGLLFVVRLTAFIVIPGIDGHALAEFFDKSQQNNGGLMALYNTFAGGAAGNCALGALGVMPYISATIIIQLLTAVWPRLSKLAREEGGRTKIIQYGRYGTVLLCLVQGGYFASTWLHPERTYSNWTGGHLVLWESKWLYYFVTVTIITSGTMLLMWLGEQITERGIGNGVSLIITVGILARLPNAVQGLKDMFIGQGGQEAPHGLGTAILLVALLIIVIGGVIAITQAQRKIPVQYAQRAVGRKVYAGGTSYMPLKVNYSGVMPIIFAQSILMFPHPILIYLADTVFVKVPLFHDNLIWAARLLDYGSFFYMSFFGLMILFFSYFWVATQFNEIQIADDLKKNGGYIPGVRPGQGTSEYLHKAMSRITLAGAVFLTVIAVLPIILISHYKIDQYVGQFFGGTSILIAVGVLLDTMRQVESHLMMRHYDGFLKKGRVRGRF